MPWHLPVRRIKPNSITQLFGPCTRIAVSEHYNTEICKQTAELILDSIVMNRYHCCFQNPKSWRYDWIACIKRLGVGVFNGSPPTHLVGELPQFPRQRIMINVVQQFTFFVLD